MDSVRNDPELATELITLLGKELKSARERIRELEGQISHGNREGSTVINGSREPRERAETSETPVVEIERLTSENAELRLLLEASRLRVKEEGTEEKITPEKRHDEPNLDLLNKVKELEEALEVYHGKYKAQKEAKRTLRKTLAELETRINDLTQENQQIRQTAAKVMPMKQPSLPGQPEFTEFMAKFPHYDEQPYHPQLRPICHKGVDIMAYLDSDSKLAKFSNNFLYFPGRLVWCRRRHGLAFGPQHVFDTSKRCWNKKSTFERQYGKQFELFHDSKDLIYYRGTYTCHNLRSWSPEGSPIPNGASTIALVEATQSGNASKSVKNIIQRLYADQVLKVETMGLQCIGFNTELYEALDRRFRASQPVLGKRKGSQLEGEQPAKRIRGT